MRIDSALVAGVPCLVAGTGYTGELGYEVWCHPKHAPEVWDAVFEAAARIAQELDAAGVKVFQQPQRRDQGLPRGDADDERMDSETIVILLLLRVWRLVPDSARYTIVSSAAATVAAGAVLASSWGSGASAARDGGTSAGTGSAD